MESNFGGKFNFLPQLEMTIINFHFKIHIPPMGASTKSAKMFNISSVHLFTTKSNLKCYPFSSFDSNGNDTHSYSLQDSYSAKVSILWKVLRKTYNHNWDRSVLNAKGDLKWNSQFIIYFYQFSFSHKMSTFSINLKQRR
jgi:hypothetical protein